MDSTHRVAKPLHVLYGGAHLFKEGSIAKLGALAVRAMETHGEDDAVFATLVGAMSSTATADRVRKKLANRPIESICIDFEDGYGIRSDSEEDAEADRVGAVLAAIPEGGDDAPRLGIRIKADPKRGERTLERVLAATTGKLPPGFTVTLPKVETAAHVERLLSQLNDHPTIGIELMIETPPAVRAIAELTLAAGDRLVALHLGAYDLTASLGVTAVDQRLDHPFCDYARSAMAYSATNTTTTLVDGATTLMPIGDRNAVHRAWELHARNVRRAIDFGMWQGWDLHPAQVPARYGALFGYFLDHKDAMAARLRSFLDKKAQAGRVGQEFDDAATGRGLIEFFDRGVRCGALDEADVPR